MPNLTQAELLQDLERQHGTVFRRTMLQLLSRGRSGIRQVAARLGGDMDAQLDASLKASGRQVIEMVVRAGTLGEECGIALLQRLEPVDLVDKASELWERGEREEARSIVERLGPGAAATGPLHLMKARIALASGSLDDSLALYRKAAGACLHSRGILEGASLALENGRLDDAAGILGRASGDDLDQLMALAGEVLHGALQQGDEQILVSCCGRLAERGHTFLACSMLAAVGVVRKLNSNTIRDMREHLNTLGTALSKADLEAQGLLSETLPAAEVISRVGSALAEFEELACQLGGALDAGLPAAGATAHLAPLAEALLRTPGSTDQVAAEISRIASETMGQTCAASLREAATAEVESSLRGLWARTRDAIRDSLSAAGSLRSLSPQRAAETPRVSLFERVAADISFMNAWLDDAELCLVMSEGGQERYELLAGVLEDAVRAPQALARERQAGLSADIQRDLPRLLLVRPWISRAVQNLVNLAVRQAGAGGMVALIARVPVQGTGVEIIIKGDAVAMPPGLRTLDQVLANHHWRIVQPRETGHSPVLTIYVHESSEEDALRSEIEGYDGLEAGTKQALRAAEALGGSAGSAAAAAFLYTKALEIEISSMLLPELERHVLLPRALSLKNDPQAFAEAARAAAAAVGTADREVLKRAEQVVDAIVRSRVQKEIGDWRSLSVTLALFGTLSSGGRHLAAGEDSLLKALYRAEQIRDASRTGGAQFQQARSLCRTVLSGLSGLKAERMGRRPPHPG